jgi:hypothetical protein
VIECLPGKGETLRSHHLKRERERERERETAKNRIVARCNGPHLWTLWTQAGGSLEYRSSRLAWAMYQDPTSKDKQKSNKKKKE